MASFVLFACLNPAHFRYPTSFGSSSDTPWGYEVTVESVGADIWGKPMQLAESAVVPGGRSNKLNSGPQKHKNPAAMWQQSWNGIWGSDEAPWLIGFHSPGATQASATLMELPVSSRVNVMARNPETTLAET
ncbi:hypothetical protein FQN52_002467 [Onygenales sp. PD_12]|nr:hypothetical protein FQN52_002467 [Onygenales sp. PD_12]